MKRLLICFSLIVCAALFFAAGCAAGDAEGSFKDVDYNYEQNTLKAVPDARYEDRRRPFRRKMAGASLGGKPRYRQRREFQIYHVLFRYGTVFRGRFGRLARVLCERICRHQKQRIQRVYRPRGRLRPAGSFLRNVRLRKHAVHARHVFLRLACYHAGRGI